MANLSLPARAHLNRRRSVGWRLLALILGKRCCEDAFYREIEDKNWVGYDGTTYPP